MIVLKPVIDTSTGLVDLVDIFEMQGDEMVWFGSRRTEALALEEWGRHCARASGAPRPAVQPACYRYSGVGE